MNRGQHKYIAHAAKLRNVPAIAQKAHIAGKFCCQRFQLRLQRACTGDHYRRIGNLRRCPNENFMIFPVTQFADAQQHLVFKGDFQLLPQNAAIARGEFPFTSRGDDSSTHQLEQQFWPANQVFGDWYISADMEMGPCLVMNDLEGGYILTDKLTWLIYSTANGII